MSPAPAIAAVARALPPHVYEQETLRALLGDLFADAGADGALLDRFAASTQVARRHLALPREGYRERRDFAASNAVWQRVGLDLAEEATRAVLARAGVAPTEVDHVFFVSTTGIATPSLDAGLANRIGLPAHVRRSPLFGLGCGGGAAGIARAADVLRARPRDTALVVTLELCSLTLQRDDVSVANLIAACLFGDACAAALLRGAEAMGEAPAPRVRESRCVFFPGTEHIMGWDVRPTGLGVMLTADVPEVARHDVPPHVDAFLADHGLARADVAHWIFHSGGPRVLDAFAEGLGLPAGALDLSRRCLRAVGNVSSASVLLVLEDRLETSPPGGGEHAMLLALGPGFSAEASLLAW